MKNFDLTNKYCLITGAAGLLGNEHALALLDIGANLILTDLDLTKLKKSTKNIIQKNKNKNKILYFKMDVSNEKSIDKVIKEINQKKIFVSVLINNAAINPKVEKNSEKFTRLENIIVKDVINEFKVGLLGALLCSIKFGSIMAKKNGGVILNISSDLSVISPDQRLYLKKGVKDINQPVKPVSYSIIKSGLVGLTKYVATYWANKNVRCNCLSPGGVENNQNNSFKKKLHKLIPLGRMANKDEYHGAIQFLCSKSSSYLNGQNIVIDGGRTVW